ncbi:hypothetical protein N8E91_22385, partial [Pseudomonas aeruginosa PA14]|uniref:hypothetical protein n=1 Tax=Pseudomonas aeruginosa TaxID=287 RepID=UPI0021C86916
MTDAGSLRGRLLLWLALLLLLVLLASGLSAYWNGREVADTAYDRRRGLPGAPGADPARPGRTGRLAGA